MAWYLAWNWEKNAVDPSTARPERHVVQLVVYAGRDGRGRDEYARRTLTGVSRREATKAHAQLLIDVQHGRTGPSRSLTVNQLAQRWWDAAARDLSPSTRIGYRGWLESRVLPEFGKKRISSVTTADVEYWYGKLRDGDKPLSVRSVRGGRTVLSAMFTAAVRWGYLPMSPVRGTSACAEGTEVESALTGTRPRRFENRDGRSAEPGSRSVLSHGRRGGRPPR